MTTETTDQLPQPGFFEEGKVVKLENLSPQQLGKLGRVLDLIRIPTCFLPVNQTTHRVQKPAEPR